MSECVRPSSSQTAMSIAFKKARRKFPKNFGLTPNRVELPASSEDEDSSGCENEEKSVSKPYDPIDEQINEKTTADHVETELVDSFKEVKLSEQAEIICERCQDEPESFVSVDLNEPQNSESKSHQESEFIDELPIKTDPSNYLHHETRERIGLIWNGEFDRCDNYESEIDEEAPPRKYNERPTRRKLKSHRRKKTSHCHSMDHVYVDDRFEYPCHAECIHCQHYYRHCSCCRVHCFCCACCCLIWQEHPVISHEWYPSCSQRRRSKKKRCSTCSGKRRSSSPSITCSRDSGIFTQTRLEDYCDDDVGEEEDNGSTTLMHKDSLSILQEKYAKKKNGRDEEGDEAAKGRKIRRRIASRYSYY